MLLGTRLCAEPGFASPRLTRMNPPPPRAAYRGGASRVAILSKDDGCRVCSDVTEEGLLIYDFSEIRARGLSAGTASYSGLPSMSPEDA
jgi:hypothetical protein